MFILLIIRLIFFGENQQIPKYKILTIQVNYVLIGKRAWSLKDNDLVN